MCSSQFVETASFEKLSKSTCLQEYWQNSKPVIREYDNAARHLWNLGSTVTGNVKNQLKLWQWGLHLIDADLTSTIYTGDFWKKLVLLTDTAAT